MFPGSLDHLAIFFAQYKNAKLHQMYTEVLASCYLPNGYILLVHPCSRAEGDVELAVVSVPAMVHHPQYTTGCV